MSRSLSSAPATAMLAGLLASSLAAPVHAQCAHEQGLILASDGAYHAEFGYALDLAGQTAVVGAWPAAAAASLSGKAYVLRKGAAGWFEEQLLLPPDGQLGDFFGWSVAVDGDTAAIGSVSDEDAAPDGGSVYVYRFDGERWALEVELFASDAAQGDHFGVSLALDGETLLVGADLDGDHGTWSGSAYVFRRIDGVWVETHKLHPSTHGSYDHFGYALDLDGELAMIGAYGTEAFRGAAYVFRWDGAAWSEEARLVGSQSVGGDFFGASVAVSGERVLSGARWADIGVLDTGEAYVFRRAGASWYEEQRLAMAVPKAGDGFGFSVDLSGGLALVGAHTHDEVGPDSGAAVLFRLDGGIWVREPDLVPAGAQAQDLFGLAVAIEGGSALIGAPWEDDQAENAGAVHAFDTSPCFGCEAPPAGGTGCQPFHASPAALDLTYGGAQSMWLDAGAEHAAQLYLVLGSHTGTSPGIPTTAGTLPLVLDPYTLLLLQSPNPGFLPESLGFLDGKGRASIALGIPGGIPASPGLAGTPFHHAFVVLSVSSGAVLLASNADQLSLIP